MSRRRRRQRQPCRVHHKIDFSTIARVLDRRFALQTMTYHNPHKVILMMMFCSVKNSSMSHVVEGQAAIGVLQVSGSGEPDVISAGMFER